MILVRTNEQDEKCQYHRSDFWRSEPTLNNVNLNSNCFT